MSKARIAAAASIVGALWLVPAVASAQATRTWVSGVGDDANPCSRTAPCKTFAGAISKTAIKGEIDTLDPGGFGGVTITKSITIDGTSGIAGVLVSGTNAIVIAAGASDVVILRNLDIDGIGGGLAGIYITGAGDVRIEHCKIFGFTGRGIDDRRTSGELFVTDTIVSDNGQTGILALSGGGSTLNVTLDRVQMHNNGNTGFAITGGAHAAVMHSISSSNAAHGFYADSGSSVDLDDSLASNNVSSGIASMSGATVRINNTTVTSNGAGLSTTPGSQILSYGNNRIAGNYMSNGPPTGTITLQ
jgi:Right handed beta helix region